MTDLLPLWQTLAGGGVTLLATVVTQQAIGRRDRKAREKARIDELSDRDDEREHARRLEVRARSREAAERTLALAVDLRDTALKARGEDDPFLSSEGSGLNALTSSALLIEDDVVRRTLSTASTTIVLWSAQVLFDELPRAEARREQAGVMRGVVSLLSAYLRGDDVELEKALADLSGASSRVREDHSGEPEAREADEGPA